jgi:hypothetical protein
MVIIVKNFFLPSFLDAWKSLNPHLNGNPSFLGILPRFLSLTNLTESSSPLILPHNKPTFWSAFKFWFRQHSSSEGIIFVDLTESSSTQLLPHNRNPFLICIQILIPRFNSQRILWSFFFFGVFEFFFHFDF